MDAAESKFRRRQSELSETTKQWQRRSARFVGCSRVFFLTLAVGLLYAGYYAMSFAPALRQAQFDTDAIRQSSGVDAYAAAWRNVVETWPQRLAQNAVGPFEWLGFFSIFVIGTAILWLYRSRPTGKRIDLAGMHPMMRSRFETALAEHGELIHLYERTDDPRDAARVGEKVYLPRTLLNLLSLRRNDEASQQLLFVLEHEAQHDRAVDNVFVALGRSIIFLAMVIIVVLIAAVNFVGVGLMVLFPASWSAAVGDMATLVLLALIFFFFLLMTGALMNGFNAAFYAAREFFADVIPASWIELCHSIYPNVDAPASEERCSMPGGCHQRHRTGLNTWLGPVHARQPLVHSPSLCG